MYVLLCVIECVEFIGERVKGLWSLFHGISGLFVKEFKGYVMTFGS